MGNSGSGMEKQTSAAPAKRSAKRKNSQTTTTTACAESDTSALDAKTDPSNDSNPSAAEKKLKSGVSKSTVSDYRSSCLVTTVCGSGECTAEGRWQSIDGYGASAKIGSPAWMCASADGDSLFILKDSPIDGVKRLTLPTERAKTKLHTLIASALASTNLQISPLISLITGYAVNDGMCESKPIDRYY